MRIHKLQSWEMTKVTVIHFVLRVALYIPTPAVSRRRVALKQQMSDNVRVSGPYILLAF